MYGVFHWWWGKQFSDRYLHYEKAELKSNERTLTPFGAPSPPASENVNNVTALVINAPPIQSTFKL